MKPVVLVLVLAAAGCNQVYGLADTQLRDGAPPDAPFVCPPIGTAPVFSRFLHQIPVRECTEYTVSLTGRAAALCYPDGGLAGSSLHIGEGPIDGELSPVAAFTGNGTFVAPRLSPDGERLYVRRLEQGALVHEQYTRQGEAFVLTSTGALRNASLSTIASDPGGGDRVLLSISNAAGYEELVDSGGTWTVVATHTPDQLGLGTREIEYPALSADGLRLVFTAQREAGTFEEAVWYSDRPAAGMPFRPAELLEGVPATGGLAVMTDTCARVYVSGLDRTFYVQQR